MSVTGADLIATVRQKANVERSRFVSDLEILGFCNDSIAELCDIVTNASEGYFSKQATFTLASGASSIGIAQAVTGVAPDPAFPVVGATPDGNRIVPEPPGPVFSSTVGTQTIAQFFAVGGTASSNAPLQSFIPPAGRVLSISLNPTTTVPVGSNVAIYKNGVPTDIALFISGGASGTQNFDETNWSAPVYFNGEDTMDLMIQSNTAHSAWLFECETVYQLSQPKGDFLKELALSYTRSGRTVEIPRLASLADRGRVGTPHFWIAGNTISFYPKENLPTGVIALDYDPSIPVLTSEDTLPAEFERFRDFVELGGVIAVKAKRGMSDDVAQFSAKQAAVRSRVIASVTHRKRGPRTLSPPDKDRTDNQFYYRRWYNGL